MYLTPLHMQYSFHFISSRPNQRVHHNILGQGTKQQKQTPCTETFAKHQQTKTNLIMVVTVVTSMGVLKYLKAAMMANVSILSGFRGHWRVVTLSAHVRSTLPYGNKRPSCSFCPMKIALHFKTLGMMFGAVKQGLIKKSCRHLTTAQPNPNPTSPND